MAGRAYSRMAASGHIIFRKKRMPYGWEHERAKQARDEYTRKGANIPDIITPAQRGPSRYASHSGTAVSHSTLGADEVFQMKQQMNRALEILDRVYVRLCAGLDGDDVDGGEGEDDDGFEQVSGSDEADLDNDEEKGVEEAGVASTEDDDAREEEESGDDANGSDRGRDADGAGDESQEKSDNALKIFDPEEASAGTHKNPVIQTHEKSSERKKAISFMKTFQDSMKASTVSFSDMFARKFHQNSFLNVIRFAIRYFTILLRVNQEEQEAADLIMTSFETAISAFYHRKKPSYPVHSVEDDSKGKYVMYQIASLFRTMQARHVDKIVELEMISRTKPNENIVRIINQFVYFTVSHIMETYRTDSTITAFLASFKDFLEDFVVKYFFVGTSLEPCDFFLLDLDSAPSTPRSI